MAPERAKSCCFPSTVLLPQSSCSWLLAWNQLLVSPASKGTNVSAILRVTNIITCANWPAWSDLWASVSGTKWALETELHFLCSQLSLLHCLPLCNPIYGICENTQEQHRNTGHGCLLWKEKSRTQVHHIFIHCEWVFSLMPSIPAPYAEPHGQREKSHNKSKLTQVTPLPGLLHILTLYLEYSLNALNSTKENIFNQNWGDGSEVTLLWASMMIWGPQNPYRARHRSSHLSPQHSYQYGG